MADGFKTFEKTIAYAEKLMEPVSIMYRNTRLLPQ